MSIDQATDLIQHSLILALMVSAPMLCIGLIVGVLVSLFQAVTQIQEQTLTFIPKLLAMAAVLALTGPWMIRNLVEYSRGLIESIPGLVG